MRPENIALTIYPLLRTILLQAGPLKSPTWQEYWLCGGGKKKKKKKGEEKIQERNHTAYYQPFSLWQDPASDLHSWLSKLPLWPCLLLQSTLLPWLNRLSTSQRASWLQWHQLHCRVAWSSWWNCCSRCNVQAKEVAADSLSWRRNRRHVFSFWKGTKTSVNRWFLAQAWFVCLFVFFLSR